LTSTIRNPGEQIGSGTCFDTAARFSGKVGESEIFMMFS